MKLFFELFAIYCIYKLVFDLIIPIYGATKQIKRKMEDVQQQMQQNQSSSFTNKTGPSNFSKTDSKEDYIDFEEIK